MKNLETSAKVISSILAKLLENGLKESFLQSEDFGLSEDETLYLRTCFDWLADEGIVRWTNTSHSKDSSAWIDPVLTSRGFALLGSKLEFDGQQITVAEIVEQGKAVKGNYTVIGDFLGAAMGGLIKSIGS